MKKITFFLFSINYFRLLDWSTASFRATSCFGLLKPFC
jgi:hypothetical protein